MRPISYVGKFFRPGLAATVLLAGAAIVPNIQHARASSGRTHQICYWYTGGDVTDSSGNVRVYWNYSPNCSLIDGATYFTGNHPYGKDQRFYLYNGSGQQVAQVDGNSSTGQLGLPCGNYRAYGAMSFSDDGVNYFRVGTDSPLPNGSYHNTCS